MVHSIGRGIPAVKIARIRKQESEIVGLGPEPALVSLWYVAVLHLERGRVETAGRNDIPRERIARERILDRERPGLIEQLRKIPLPECIRGHVPVVKGAAG